MRGPKMGKLILHLCADIGSNTLPYKKAGYDVKLIGSDIGVENYSTSKKVYGDPWTKKTTLWGKFNIPDKLFTKWEDVSKNDKLYIRPGRPKPGMAFLHKSAINNIPAFDGISVKDDMSFRSLCSQGFANAFFSANK